MLSTNLVFDLYLHLNPLPYLTAYTSHLSIVSPSPCLTAYTSYLSIVSPSPCLITYTSHLSINSPSLIVVARPLLIRPSYITGSCLYTTSSRTNKPPDAPRNHVRPTRLKPSPLELKGPCLGNPRPTTEHYTRSATSRRPTRVPQLSIRIKRQSLTWSP